MEEEEEYYSEEEFPSPEMSTASEMGSDSDSSTPTHGLAPFEPLGRRGQWCGVHGDKFYLYGGYAGAVDLQGSSQGQLDVFDFASCEWSVFATEGDLPKATSGACSTIMGDCLYMFGGWYRGYWNADRNADVYELNLMNFKWKKLTGENCAKGSPLDKDKAAMVDYGNEMLCVTGGYGHSRSAAKSQKGASFHLDTDSFFQIGWTNELHLFHVKSCECSIIAPQPLILDAWSYCIRASPHAALLAPAMLLL